MNLCKNENLYGNKNIITIAQLGLPLQTHYIINISTEFVTLKYVYACGAMAHLLLLAMFI